MECSNAEEEVSGDTYVEHEVGMQGRKRKASMSPSKQQTIGAEIQNKNVHGIKMIITRSYSLKNTTCDFSVIFCMYTGQYLRSENEMLRRQLACKTKELEAEMIRRLKVELDSKKKENKSLRKENEKLRDENEYYRKTVSLLIIQNNQSFK